MSKCVKEAGRFDSSVNATLYTGTRRGWLVRFGTKNLYCCGLFNMGNLLKTLSIAYELELFIKTLHWRVLKAAKMPNCSK